MKKLSKIKEEFSAGIGNTQAPANSKKEPPGKKKPFSTFKKKKLADGSNKVVSTPPSSSKGDTDTKPAIGGE